MKTLNEILDSHYPFEKDGERDFPNMKKYSYKFKSTGGKYGVHFYHNKSEKNPRVNIFFDNNGEMGITGKERGKSNKIISTVSHITRHHMKDYPDHNLEFSSDGGGRTRLYDRLTKNNNGKSIKLDSGASYHTIRKVGISIDSPDK